MSDIFISYSRRDAEQAQLLTELLSSAGLSVWIDQSGIDIAASWSGEIVDAIDGCKAMIVMLSPSSNESKNVAREVALASERNKKILPLDLEPISLSRDLAYHLAGLQRAPMTNIDAVIRALGKLGLEATGAPQPPKIVKEADGRKSLMILPFEDLSPTGDNAWFADGIVSELISALSKVTALRVSDNQATKEFKSYHGQLSTYAREMGIRYFIQGDVRKFGDQIKISSRLLDIETGDNIWQDAMKGVMNDIFEIQESVALNVVEGLKIHLASDEKKKLAERGTDNAEAYEMYMKALEYYHLLTKRGMELALQLLTEAIRLDPDYANAYSSKAYILSELYGLFNRDPNLIEEGILLVNAAFRLKRDLWEAYMPLSNLYRLKGEMKEAEKAAKEYIQKASKETGGYLTLGYFYMNTGQLSMAVAPYEEILKLDPDNWNILFNLVIAYGAAKDIEKQKLWATTAAHRYERFLKLFPGDENKRVDRAILLHFAGRDDEARAAARGLDNLRDGAALHNVACLQSELGDYKEALRTSRKSIEAGYQNIHFLMELLNENVVILKGTPEYAEVMRMVEGLSELG